MTKESQIRLSLKLVMCKIRNHLGLSCLGHPSDQLAAKEANRCRLYDSNSAAAPHARILKCWFNISVPLTLKNRKNTLQLASDVRFITMQHNLFYFTALQNWRAAYGLAQCVSLCCTFRRGFKKKSGAGEMIENGEKSIMSPASSGIINVSSKNKKGI